MKKIVITGASGFIGKYVIKKFVEHDIPIIAVVRSDAGIISIQNFINDQSLFSNISFLKKDIKDIHVSDFQGNDVNGWIHLAWGGVSCDGVNDEVIQRGNYENAIHCLKTAKKIGCTYFANSGSRAECDKDIQVIDERFYDSDSLNMYGFYKKEFYKYAKEFCETNKVIFHHLRLFSVIGLEDHPWSVIMTACRKILDQEIMQLGSCEQKFNFLDVVDVANAFYSCYKKRDVVINGSIINVAAPESRILRDYIESIPRIANMNSIFQFGNQMGFNSNPVVEKLIIDFAWKQTISYDASIQNIIENYLL